jgi:hypothetical protein
MAASATVIEAWAVEAVAALEDGCQTAPLWASGKGPDPDPCAIVLIVSYRVSGPSPRSSGSGSLSPSSA